MRTTIDKAGRIVVPKRLREELGFAPGAALEVEAIDGRLEVSMPSQVHVEEGPYGPRLVADGPEDVLTVDDVRAVVESMRR